jgi:preprotein translocase subunit SecE
LGVRFPPGLPAFAAAKEQFVAEAAASGEVDTGVSNNVAEEAGRFDTVREAAGGRFERMRLFLSEVRNELKRVTWPSQKEVYATTVVVILTSVFFGLYLFALDFGLLKLVQWIFRLFGVAGPTA